MILELPYNWNPRDYQKPVFIQMENGIRFVILMWHRRSGKDEVCLHKTACAAMERPGNYWHLLPQYSQARKAIWNARNPETGKKRIDEAFPKHLRKKTLEDQMFIEFKNDSTWQLMGSDNYDSLVGAPPVGIVFSEFALSNPSAWDYLRPMLIANGGWAMFNSTVRGRNHFWELTEYAKTDPDWFVSIVDANESGVFTKEQLDKELQYLIKIRGQTEGTSLFRQEYMNDSTASVPGTFYGELMQRARDEGRITHVPYMPHLPVFTAWDVGVSDDTTIWFIQKYGFKFHVIDFYENHGQDPAFYAKYLQNLPYLYSGHLLPHDAAHRTNSEGLKTIQQQLEEAGLKDTHIVPRTPSKIMAINAVRFKLPLCYFDEVKCKRGTLILSMYRRDVDDNKKIMSNIPLHDWASHGADGFATFAQGYHLIENNSSDYDHHSTATDDDYWTRQ